MQIEIKIDTSLKEPKIIVYTDKISEEIHEMIKKLSGNAPQMIVDFYDETLKILEQTELSRIYAEAGKVFAITDSGKYTLRLRLYELEERLDKSYFVRISNSEIINLKKVKNFDLSLIGTICVSMIDGTCTYVSRRYVSKIKQVLGI